jgi:hypothetical protein
MQTNQTPESNPKNQGQTTQHNSQSPKMTNEELLAAIMAMPLEERLDFLKKAEGQTTPQTGRSPESNPRNQGQGINPSNQSQTTPQTGRSPESNPKNQGQGINPSNQSQTTKLGEVQSKMSADVKKTDELSVGLKANNSDKVETVTFKSSEDLKKGDKVKITIEKV